MSMFKNQIAKSQKSQILLLHINRSIMFLLKFTHSFYLGFFFVIILRIIQYTLGLFFSNLNFSSEIFLPILFYNFIMYNNLIILYIIILIQNYNFN